MNTTGKTTNVDKTFSTYNTELFDDIKNAYKRGAELIDQGYEMLSSLEEGINDCIHFYVKVNADGNYKFIFVFKDDDAIKHYNECTDKEDFMRRLTQDFVHTMFLIKEHGMDNPDEIRGCLEYCYEQNVGLTLEWVA